MTLSDWSDLVSIVGTIMGVAVAIAAVITYFHEARNKRTQFFLNQHRRLFDDKDLFEILGLIRDDNDQLNRPEMQSKKQKFLTFIEEMWLLVKVGYLTKDAAIYMFGFYASKAKNGENFRSGFSLTPENWQVFLEFVEEYEKKKGELAQLEIKL